MKDEMYNYIYDALCLAMDLMEDLEIDATYIKEYEKLNKAAGMLLRWYNEENKKD